MFAEYLSYIFTPNQTKAEKNLPIIDNRISENVAEEIKNNINQKKTPGYNPITGEVLKQLPRKSIVKLTHLLMQPKKIKICIGR